MKINMHSRKTMLAAILVVAAFAAFSAAAVFEDAQSDAAVTVTAKSVVTGTYTIKADADDGDIAFNTHGDGKADAKIIIAEGASFSGNLYFGKSTGERNKFTAYAMISLDKVGGKTGELVLKCAADNDIAIITGDAKGTVKMTEGRLQLGHVDDDPADDVAFSGTASGNTVTIKSQNTAGFVIVATADKKTDQIHGDVVSVVPEGAADDTVYAADIGGAARFITTDDEDDDENPTHLLSVEGEDDAWIDMTFRGTFDFIRGKGEAFPLEDCIIFHNTVVEFYGVSTFNEAVSYGEVDPLWYNYVIVHGKLEFTGIGFEAGDSKNKRMFDETVLSAAFYSVEDRDGRYTHVYTTLENAMEASDTIFVTGEHYITEDIELTGKASDKNTMTFIYDSYLIIGTDHEETESFPAIAEVPLTTDIVIHDHFNLEFIWVYAGGLIFEDITVATESEPFIISDVYLETDDAVIYADLATALDLSVSGDEITVRDTGGSDTIEVRGYLGEYTIYDVVHLISDAVLKDGVLLNANGKNLVVDEDATFTVDGTIEGIGGDYETNYWSECQGLFTVLGTLILNNAVVSFEGYDYSDPSHYTNILLIGGMTVGESFDNTGEGGQRLYFDRVETSGTLEISGRLWSEGYPHEIDLSGTLVTDYMNAVKLRIRDGATVIAYDAETPYAVISGRDITVGTAPGTWEQYVNGAKARIGLHRGGSCTVFGSAADVEVLPAHIPNGHYVISTGYYSGNSLYATVWDTYTLVNYYLPHVPSNFSIAPHVDIYALDRPEVEGQVFQAWYALPSFVGGPVGFDAKIGEHAKVYADFDDGASAAPDAGTDVQTILLAVITVAAIVIAAVVAVGLIKR